MFTKARLKLTGWYLVIIMLVSISFSVAMYEALTVELDRVESIHLLRQEQQFSLPDFDDLPFELRQRGPRMFMIDPELIEDAKHRLIISLVLINLGILGGSSLAGYFLAGRTLRPIKEMVDEQNRFVSDASHELRTPITSLKTEIEVNLRDKGLGENTKEILRSNLDDVNNLQMLSDNLIKLTQYEKGNGNVMFDNISLKELVEGACRKVASLAKHKKIVIDNRVEDCEVWANRQSLGEAFVVFLDNAIKYSKKGSGVRLISKISEKSVVVDIEDEGIGIEKEDIDHIFDRFYRADKSRTKGETEGFGLGLSIAEQIIKKHKGSIGVKSVVGKGTTFSIKLPLKGSSKSV
jgi:signal transduction histidine kinase